MHRERSHVLVGIIGEQAARLHMAVVHQPHDIVDRANGDLGFLEERHIVVHGPGADEIADDAIKFDDMDEALSVGDTYFQHKSFDRIRQFRDQGTTLLFVSHSAGSIKTLCTRALLLDGGIVVRDDAPDAVLDYYNAVIAKQRTDHEIQQMEQLTGRKVTRSGSGDAAIQSVELLVDGVTVRSLTSGVPATIQIKGTTAAPVDELTAGIVIRDRLGNDVFGTNTHHHHVSKMKVPAGDSFLVEFHFPALNLGLGSFSVSAALHSRDVHIAANYDWWDRALVFQVLPGDAPTSIGVCCLPVMLSWK